MLIPVVKDVFLLMFRVARRVCCLLGGAIVGVVVLFYGSVVCGWSAWMVTGVCWWSNEVMLYVNVVGEI